MYDFATAHNRSIESANNVFTPEESAKVESQLNQKYIMYLNKKAITVECLKIADEICLRVLIANPDQSFYYPIDAKFNLLKYGKVKSKEAAWLMLDYIDTYLSEYFYDNDTFLTIEWSNHSFEDKEFLLKGQIYNVQLEKQADELIKNSQH